MDWTPYQVFLACLLVITGTINTISIKWADSILAKDAGGRKRKFDHPFVQCFGMFIGELSCLLMYYVARKAGNIRIGAPVAEKFSILIFWPAAVCDMCATTLMYIGLNLTSAASYQMLQGAVIIFTALLSVAFLHRIVRKHMWLGMFTIVVALVLVGVSDILVSKVTQESQNFMNAKVAGDLLIIMAQIITATQMVYEEKIMRQHNVPPLMAVGLEGFFGTVTLGALLYPMYYIIVGAPFTTDYDGRLENVKDAVIQMSNSWQIIIATVGNMVSIAFFNFAGISVTQEISATTRMVLSSCRTFLVLIISIAVKFTFWQACLIQLSGFILLLIGMFLYNDIIIRPCLLRIGCLKRHTDMEVDPDEFEPLLGSDALDVNKQREVTHGGSQDQDRRAPIN